MDIARYRTLGHVLFLVQPVYLEGSVLSPLFSDAWFGFAPIPDEGFIRITLIFSVENSLLPAKNAHHLFTGRTN
jgi:hypothetical protein